MKKKDLFFLFLCLGVIFIAAFPRFAGGGGSVSCVGILCSQIPQKTYWSENEYAGYISWRSAVGERSFEMFPNFYRFAYWLTGDILGNPYVQTGLKIAEEASYGTPIGADEAIFRGLRAVPEYFSRFEHLAGAGATLGVLRSVRQELGIRTAGLERMEIIPFRGEIVPIHHRIVRQGGDEFIEFEAKRAYLPGMTVTHGSNQTPLAIATIDPLGRVIVVEGRHRAVATAAGDMTVPLSLGGMPMRPNWLQFNYLPYLHPVVQSYIP